MTEKKYTGQNFEDKLIDELMPNGIDTILDLGANGIDLSNSYYFIERGAKAVLVEPSPKAYVNLKEIYKGNSNVNIFNVAIGKENGIMPFYESGEHLGKGDTSLLSTLKEEELKRWEGSGNTFEKIEVTVWDFKTLMEHSSIKTFDLISIDIEGGELDLLPQMNFDELKTKVVVIEWNGNLELYDEFNKCFTSFGFLLHHKNLENLIFVRK